MNRQARDRKRRSYLPAVESLERLRQASGTTPGLPAVSAEYASPTDPVTRTELLASDDAEARQGDRIGPARDDGHADLHRTGLAQLARYLDRSWSRAMIPPQRHDDCSQEVYLTLLEGWGPDRFHRLIGDVGRRGIRDVLGRETAAGPEFFRAIDRVKMRARRERRCPSLADADAVASARLDELATQRLADLHEAMLRVLGPREAALIDATLAGETPAAIAASWGVTAKTVSNTKSHALHKLRVGLLGPCLSI